MPTLETSNETAVPPQRAVAGELGLNEVAPVRRAGDVLAVRSPLRSPVAVLRTSGGSMSPLVVVSE